MGKQHQTDLSQCRPGLKPIVRPANEATFNVPGHPRKDFKQNYFHFWKNMRKETQGVLWLLARRDGLTEPTI